MSNHVPPDVARHDLEPARPVAERQHHQHKAERQGEHFNLKDVRFIDADTRLIELDAKKHEPNVATVMKALPQEEQDALKPPR